MDLRPLKEDGFVLRDVVLVLKCVKSVKWVIKAHNVQGKLDVVVRTKKREENSLWLTGS